MTDESTETPRFSGTQTPAQRAEVSRIIAAAAPLIDAGAVAIAITYSGSGDEGFVDASYALDENREMLEVLVPPELADALERFAPEDFEDADGGEGTVELDLSSGVIEVRHSRYVTVTEDSAYTLAPESAG